MVHVYSHIMFCDINVTKYTLEVATTYFINPVNRKYKPFHVFNVL